MALTIFFPIHDHPFEGRHLFFVSTELHQTMPKYNAYTLCSIFSAESKIPRYKIISLSDAEASFVYLKYGNIMSTTPAGTKVYYTADNDLVMDMTGRPYCFLVQEGAGCV